MTTQPGALSPAVLASRPAGSGRTAKRLRAVALNVAGLGVAVVSLAPIVWMI